MTVPEQFAIGSSSWSGVAKTTEECGELVQVLGRLVQMGGRLDHWTGDLTPQLTDEIGDVLAAIHHLRAHNPILNDEEIENRMWLKIDLFEKWYWEDRNEAREAQLGRPLYEMCEACNYGSHRCPACGDDVPHGMGVHPSCADHLENR